MWRQCAVLVLFAAVCGQAGWASSNAEQSGQGVGALPDAPVAAGPSGVSVARVVAKPPLELQEHPPVKVFDVPLNMLRDGVHIAASPAYLRWRDLKWLLPIAGGTAAALNTDTKTMTEVVSRSASFNDLNISVSDGLVDGLIVAPVALFGISLGSRNERMHETGVLSAEAMGDAYVVATVVKLAAFRERPYADNGRGNFYVGSAGFDSSFISGHSILAWSSAAVMAGESHSRWVQAGLYTAATGVSLTRVLGQQHFPSDVLVGATAGWLIGHYVFRAHHHAPLQGRAK